jgi:hypothetical protein
MKSGVGDKRKLYVLGGLFLLLGYIFYSNVLAPSSPTAEAPTRPRATPRASSAAPTQAQSDGDAPAAAARAANRNRSDEFLPKLHSKRPEDQIDPRTVDPTLRLDLLAKLQAVPPAGGGRNLFIMGQPPQPKGQETIIKPVGPVEVTKAGPPPPPPGPPPPPPLPPITFKYYGFSTVRKNGQKAAFFLNGEEISILAPGEMIDRNYKLVSIGLTSAVVQDTQSKRTQTVPLAEEATQS